MLNFLKVHDLLVETIADFVTDINLVGALTNLICQKINIIKHRRGFKVLVSRQNHLEQVKPNSFERNRELKHHHLEFNQLVAQ
jgi:hypothetical protein